MSCIREAGWLGCKADTAVCHFRRHLRPFKTRTQHLHPQPSHKAREWQVKAKKQRTSLRTPRKSSRSSEAEEDEEDILDIFGSSPEEVEAMRLLETSIAEGDDPLEAHADGEEAEADGLEKVIDYGWGVEDLDEDNDEDEIEDDDGWGVTSASPLSAGKTKTAEAKPVQQKKEEGKVSEIEERWKDVPALQALPSHVFQELKTFQEEADVLSKKKQKVKAQTSEAKTHRKLRIISGDFAGKRLLSGTGDTTRPMMEKVRAAAFNMLQSRCGDMLRLPEEAMWLDLFAGTGSVGLEALSRGIKAAHFIELDPWVVRKVLNPNLEHCEVASQSSVYTMKAEDYLQRACTAPDYATKFDFISICPPYLKVSYEEIFSLLENSPLLHEETFIVVEYPTKISFSLPGKIGPLFQLRDRKFGRTRLALFGPE